LLQRPYSVASAPRQAGTDGYEFYVRLVPIQRFTTLLWRLPMGHGMRMIGPKGKFILEPEDSRTHLFVSTGTGIAPFIAMMRETLAAGAPRKTIVLHGCSYVEELGYRELLEGFGYRDECAKICDLYANKETRAQATDAVTDAMVDALSVAGDPAYCVEELRRRRDFGIDLPIVTLPNDANWEMIEKFIRVLAPTE